MFLYTGSALNEGGPLGILLAFMIMGSVCYSVMISLGEMVSACPMPGGAIALAGQFFDESLSFTVGWFYCYTWTIFLPSELSAISVLINLWNTSVNNAVWISVFLVAAVAINMLGSAAYGETEFWLSYLKIFLVVGLIICSIVISAGGGPTGETIGFRFWRDPGPFVQYAGIPGTLGRFLGFWVTLTRAAFSYIGSEIVAIAAGETKNPRVNVPRAIKNVYIRILLFCKSKAHSACGTSNTHQTLAASLSSASPSRQPTPASHSTPAQPSPRPSSSPSRTPASRLSRASSTPAYSLRASPPQTRSSSPHPAPYTVSRSAGTPRPSLAAPPRTACHTSPSSPLASLALSRT